MNYIIATYAGTKTQYALELQLQSLFKILCTKKVNNIPTIISQITIVCPTVIKPGHIYKLHCYDSKWKQLFSKHLPDIKFEYMKYVGENNHASYDQYLQAYLKYPDFKYYLLMEDDYCIDTNSVDFDNKLVELYDKTVVDSGIGFLCTYAAIDNSNLCVYTSKKHPCHASISNGILNKASFEKLGQDIVSQYYKCCRHDIQLGFSDLLLKHDVPIYSMHTIYKALFWSSYRKRLECYSPDNVNSFLFLPIQYLTDTVNVVNVLE